MAIEVQGRSRMVEDLLERIGETIGQRAQVAAVFGEPVQRGSVTVIPVAKARFGFGGGGGTGAHRDDEGSGGGGGGGAAVTPIGYIEMSDDGAKFKRIATQLDVFAFAAAVSVVALALRRRLE